MSPADATVATIAVVAGISGAILAYLCLEALVLRIISARRT
jgi:uncharacterized DUF497 family protein